MRTGHRGGQEHFASRTSFTGNNQRMNGWVHEMKLWWSYVVSRLADWSRASPKPVLRISLRAHRLNDRTHADRCLVSACSLCMAPSISGAGFLAEIRPDLARGTSQNKGYRIGSRRINRHGGGVVLFRRPDEKGGEMTRKTGADSVNTRVWKVCIWYPR